jgi:hypothetical protein
VRSYSNVLANIVALTAVAPNRLSCHSADTPHSTLRHRWRTRPPAVWFRCVYQLVRHCGQTARGNPLITVRNRRASSSRQRHLTRVYQSGITCH